MRNYNITTKGISFVKRISFLLSHITKRLLFKLVAFKITTIKNRDSLINKAFNFDIGAERSH